MNTTLTTDQATAVLHHLFGVDIRIESRDRVYSLYEEGYFRGSGLSLTEAVLDTIQGYAARRFGNAARWYSDPSACEELLSRALSEIDRS